MALIKCPECGKDISDQAEVCIHCGFPIKKLLAKSDDLHKTDNVEMPDAKEDTDHVEKSEIEKRPVGNTLTVNVADNKQGKDSFVSFVKKKPVIVTSIVAAVIAIVILIVVLTGSSNQQNEKPVNPPFGIKFGMNIGEIKRQLVDNGLTYYADFGLTNLGLIYKGGHLYGVPLEQTSFYSNGDDTFVLEIEFRSNNSDNGNFKKILDGLTKQYGKNELFPVGGDKLWYSRTIGDFVIELWAFHHDVYSLPDVHTDTLFFKYKMKSNLD